MRNDPYKYRSYWRTDDNYTPEDVDALNDAVAVVTSDPASPDEQDSWILKVEAAAIPDGTPMGLLLALTYHGDAGVGPDFYFSYVKEDDNIHRTAIE